MLGNRENSPHPTDQDLRPKERILTGMRPTGPLHLGHYMRALENWVKLQRDYDCYFLIADYQVLGAHVNEI